MARNFRSGSAWIPGKIVQQLGPLTYLIDVSEGRLWKRHVDHLKQRGGDLVETETTVEEGATPWEPTRPSLESLVPGRGHQSEEVGIENDPVPESEQHSELPSTELAPAAQNTAPEPKTPQSTSDSQGTRSRPDYFHDKTW